MYDDAFTLQEVDVSTVNAAHYIGGMVPFIHKFIYDVSLNFSASDSVV